MISLMDFQERSLKGPVMKPDEFDIGVIDESRKRDGELYLHCFYTL